MTACGIAPLLLRFVTKLLKILVSVSVVSLNSCQNVLGMLYAIRITCSAVTTGI